MYLRMSSHAMEHFRRRRRWTTILAPLLSYSVQQGKKFLFQQWVDYFLSWFTAGAVWLFISYYLSAPCPSMLFTARLLVMTKISFIILVPARPKQPSWWGRRGRWPEVRWTGGRRCCRSSTSCWPRRPKGTLGQSIDTRKAEIKNCI